METFLDVATRVGHLPTAGDCEGRWGGGGQGGGKGGELEPGRGRIFRENLGAAACGEEVQSCATL